MKNTTLANQTVLASMSIDEWFPLLRDTAHSRQRNGGKYVDDIITTKVKAAIFRSPA
jgi:hypothetical protein